ncbi:hypothetical protein MPER_06048, partial [Moniliophthora perniciosa FA553]
PIAAYGALDQPTYFLDVTPFVPLLTDGKPHNFSLDVASAEDDHTINQNWFVSGLLQIVTDSSTEPTTGKMTIYDVEPYAQSSSAATVKDDGEIDITVNATRQLHIESTIVSGSGVRMKPCSNRIFISLIFRVTKPILQYQGTGDSPSAPSAGYGNQLPDTRAFRANGADKDKTIFDSITGVVSVSRPVWTIPVPKSKFRSLTPGWTYDTAEGFFSAQEGSNTANGTNNNVFRYKDASGNTYNRRVNAAFYKITWMRKVF